jgi:hypothetical protein
MGRKRKQVMTSVLISLCLLFALDTTQAQQTQDIVAVNISLEKKVITQHEPTIVTVVFNNLTRQGIDLNLGYGNDAIDIKLVDPEGRAFRKPRPAPQEGMQFSNAVHIAPGKDSATSVVLNDWFRFDKVGEYQIEVALSYHDIRDTHATLDLTVLPRDETSLVSACASLLARVQDSPSYTGALTAAKALAGIDDPSVVPFLAEAMKRKEFAGLIITALSHLKTKNAMKVLTSASESSDSETRNLAQAALSSLGKEEK